MCIKHLFIIYKYLDNQKLFSRQLLKFNIEVTEFSTVLVIC